MSASTPTSPRARNQQIGQGTSRAWAPQPPRLATLAKTAGLNPERPIPLFPAHLGAVAKTTR